MLLAILKNKGEVLIWGHICCYCCQLTTGGGMKNELPKKRLRGRLEVIKTFFFSVLQQNVSNSKERECSWCCCKYLHDLKVRTELKTQIFIRIKEKALHSQVYITWDCKALPTVCAGLRCLSKVFAGHWLEGNHLSRPDARIRVRWRWSSTSSRRCSWALKWAPGVPCQTFSAAVEPVKRTPLGL